MVNRHRVALAVIVLTTSSAMAGCALPGPWQSDPYGSSGYGSSGSASPYYSYGGSYGYGSRYSYDPYYSSYYRQGVPLRYPAYGYYVYPSYPGHYCRDDNRDGRCDRRHDRDEDDSDHDGRNDGADQGGSRPRLEHPLKDVRRLVKEREAARTVPGAATSPTYVAPARPVTSAGAAPAARAQPQPRPSSTSPTVAPRAAEPRRSTDVADAVRSGPRNDGTSVQRR
jgi:hypothetical protein